LPKKGVSESIPEKEILPAELGILRAQILEDHNRGWPGRFFFAKNAKQPGLWS
jgi:hypothetical protein